MFALYYDITVTHAKFLLLIKLLSLPKVRTNSFSAARRHPQDLVQFHIFLPPFGDFSQYSSSSFLSLIWNSFFMHSFDNPRV